ncbi:MAG: FHA domain-containing protein [Actinomycetota bacterium]|jgi:pSer/pThr/pTyr-binding forkhead associated (FHA) protein|nr:FHA domain-containing protein [Actinomycetota bacterium]
MSECPACGARVGADDKSCPSCGVRIEGTTLKFAPVRDGSVVARESIAAPEEGPVLVVRKGPEVGERFYLDADEYSLGRDPGCDIFLNDVTVSRRHALLQLQGGAVSVRDTGSLNGTYVNGVRVDSAPLENGDIVQIGTFQMIFMAGEQK